MSVTTRLVGKILPIKQWTRDANNMLILLCAPQRANREAAPPTYGTYVLYKRNRSARISVAIEARADRCSSSLPRLCVFDGHLWHRSSTSNASDRAPNSMVELSLKYCQREWPLNPAREFSSPKFQGCEIKPDEVPKHQTG